MRHADSGVGRPRAFVCAMVEPAHAGTAVQLQPVLKGGDAMRRIAKIISGVFFLVYLADVLLKKFFLASFYREFALPETASYLFLLFSVGFFLFSVMQYDTGSSE